MYGTYVSRLLQQFLTMKQESEAAIRFRVWPILFAGGLWGGLAPGGAQTNLHVTVEASSFASTEGGVAILFNLRLAWA